MNGPLESGNRTRPTLLVHGIFDSVARLYPLERGLRSRGIHRVLPVELRPATGVARLEVLGQQLASAAERARPVVLDQIHRAETGRAVHHGKHLERRAPVVER